MTLGRQNSRLMYWIMRHESWPFEDAGEVLATRKSYPEAKSFAQDYATSQNRITVWSNAREVSACWDRGVLNEPINTEVKGGP